jgi:hypothetical protein
VETPDVSYGCSASRVQAMMYLLADRGGPDVAEFVRVPVDSGPLGGGDGVVSAVVLFETAESDLVSLHGGRPDVRGLADDAAGRLSAIADAAEQVYRSVSERLRPDRVELEVTVGLSGEVGWFVAKSSASGGLKLKLSWDTTVPPPAGTEDGGELDAGDGGRSAGQAGM